MREIPNEQPVYGLEDTKQQGAVELDAGGSPLEENNTLSQLVDRTSESLGDVVDMSGTSEGEEPADESSDGPQPTSEAEDSESGQDDGNEPPVDQPPAGPGEYGDDDEQGRRKQAKLTKAIEKHAELITDPLPLKHEVILKAAEICQTDEPETDEQSPATETAADFFGTVKEIVEESRISEADTSRKFVVSKGTGELGAKVDLSYADTVAMDEDNSPEWVSQASVRVTLDLMATETPDPVQSVEFTVTKKGEDFIVEQTVLPSLTSPQGGETCEPNDSTLHNCQALVCMAEGEEVGNGGNFVEDADVNVSAERPHRIQGAIERENPEVKPLPPTPITEGSQARLESWGVPPERIEELREITSSMRYDLCKEKTARLVEKGGYITRHSQGGEEVVLPDFQNPQTRLDGDCRTITRAHHWMLHRTGWLNAVNQELSQKGQRPLKAMYMEGFSRSHFTEEGQSHTWTGLLPEDGDLNEAITVDASFQEISMTRTNGYTLKQTRYPSAFSIPTAARVSVGSFELSGSEQRLWISEVTTLGISADKKAAFGLGFFRDATDGGQVRPLLLASPDDFQGHSEGGLLLHGDGRTTLVGDEWTILSQAEEAEEIARILQGLTLVPDSTRAREAKRQHVTVYLEDPRERNI